jgi:carboxymethylenebutenolidase
MKTGMVNFPVEYNGPVPGYLAQPDNAADAMGVVVIQEWWGLNEHIKDVTRRMADEGFTALAPDLYRGVVAAEPDEARKLAMELNRDNAIKDIQGAVDYLKGLDNVSPKKIGIIGFCMGGGLTAWMSYVGKDVGAVAVFYGGGTALSDETAEKVSAAFLGIYGEADAGIPVESIRANEALLNKYNKINEFHIYPDAPHAFFNDTRQSYREEASKDAWKRAIAWFKKYLAE